MDNQARHKSKARKPSARPELEPISYEEIMANAGMSGFVSFLDVPPTEAPSANPPGAPPKQGPLDAATVITPDTVQETTTVQQRKPNTVQETPIIAGPPSVQGMNTVEQGATVQQSCTVSGSLSRAPRRWRIRRSRGIEDGHSLAEQEVYRTLWNAGAPEGDDPESSRTIRIGYDRLAALVRLSWVTVKANLRSLEKKLAIEVVAAEDSANREGKRYRVYSASAIQTRRESAGLLWVRRTRGVELLTEAPDAAARNSVKD